MGKSLYHGVDLLLLSVHKLLLERSLGGQVQRCQEVGLPTLIDGHFVVNYSHLLLLFEGQVLLDTFRHLKTGEYTFFSFAVQLIVVVSILRVNFLGDRQVSFLPQLRVGFQQPRVSIRRSDDRVAEPWHIYSVPSLEEDKVTLQDLVLKTGSECTSWSALLNNLLDLASYTRDSSDLRSSELCHLDLGVEHTFDEGSILVDLIGLSNQLELLHDLELRVDFNDNSSNADSEARLILSIGNVLNAYKSCSNSEGRGIEDTI